MTDNVTGMPMGGPQSQQHPTLGPPLAEPKVKRVSGQEILDSLAHFEGKMMRPPGGTWGRFKGLSQEQDSSGGGPLQYDNGGDELAMIDWHANDVVEIRDEGE